MFTCKIIASVLLAIVAGAASHSSAEPSGAEPPLQPLLEAPLHAKLDHSPAPWSSPILVHDGVIYVGWVTPEKDVKIATIAADGTVKEATVFNLGTTSHDKGTPSLGIDRDGYIHMAAGMHNSGWEYYVSKTPRDISEFEKHAWDSKHTIPGDRISYPRFFTDRQGTLFVTYRTRASAKGAAPGWTGGAMARYDAESRTWSSLGQKAPREDAVTPVIALNRTGRPEMTPDPDKPAWYQAYRSDVFVDDQNRLHYVYVSFGDQAAPEGRNRSSGASHLLYAVSENQGQTWKRADGSSISNMPMMLEDFDAVVVADPGNLLTDASVVVIDGGKPMIAYRRGNEGFFARWDGKAWNTSPAPDNNIQLWADAKGRLLRSGNDAIAYSEDGGRTWKPLSVGRAAGSTVSASLVDTADTTILAIRAVVKSSDGPRMHVYRISIPFK